MARPKTKNPTSKTATKERSGASKDRSFHLEFKHPAQKLAWTNFLQHDILMLMGPAGTGKTFLAIAFAINEVLAKRKKRIVITRPIVEAGESLGYLPGTFEEKVHPYMLPIYDSITKLVGKEGAQKEMISSALEVAPLAYMRGRTFDDAVCIFDEAQNATYSQLKLFVTRFGENSKIIITGDPCQSDLPYPEKESLSEFTERVSHVPGIGVVTFSNDGIVRHPLIGKLLEVL